MRRLVILGGGESGVGTAALAKKHNWDVFLSDNGTLADNYREKLAGLGVEFEEGGHTEQKILTADEVVKSPGIPDTAPIVQKLLMQCKPVISEIEFAGRYNKARTICITGSNGKTTTTTLIYKLLKEAAFNVGVAGNIGDSFAWQVAHESRDWYVIELSSFQLDGMSEFRADIAVLMNITPDHLDRYNGQMQRYIDSKMRIIRHQGYDDFFIYCEDDSNITAQLSKYELPMRLLPFSIHNHDKQVRTAGHEHSKWQGSNLEGDSFFAVVGDRRFAMDTTALKIKGKHNIYNAQAAVLAAMAAGVPDESIRKSLSSFEGVEHRLEPVGEIDGVLYINDSKATNTDSVWYALEAMDRPVVWIAGGTDKGNDYSLLEDIVRQKVRVLVLLGKDTSKLKSYFRDVAPTVYDTDNLDDAMSLARQSARSGDVVLLSPACASFDLFNNYEDRGNQFRQWVDRHR